MRNILLFALLFVPLVLTGQVWTINKDKAESYIEFLSSDLLEGREAGSRGVALARDYIISALKLMGLRPDIQSFEVNARGQLWPLNNIIAKIEGERDDEFVIIGAHYDHLGIDSTLFGDQIYNGADDNASGVSAVLQIAEAFIKNGKKPQKSIIFAFWDGEEKGLQGSKYFVSNFEDSAKIKAYINFDMIGRNSDEENPNKVDYFYSESRGEFAEWIIEDILKYNLGLDPIFHPSDNNLGGSDNSSFNKQGIPIIWYHTNGHPDYHKPGDHVEKLNWDKLVDITKSAYLIIVRLTL